MAEKIILDNLTGREIKELINDNKMNIKELDIDALNKLFDHETDMLCSGKGDMETLKQCSDLLDDANGGPLLTESEFESIIEKTKAENIVVRDKVTTRNIPVKRVISRRIFAVLASVIAIVMCSMVVVAELGGIAFDEDFIDNYLEYIFRQPAGTDITEQSVTFINNGVAKEYPSLEELEKAEDLNIMLPTVLPEGTKIENIRLINSDEYNDNILITTNKKTTVTIKLNVAYPNSSYDTYEKYIVNDRTYYISKTTNLGFCYYNNIYYAIDTDNYEDLILIIDNMREFE